MTDPTNAPAPEGQVPPAPAEAPPAPALDFGGRSPEQIQKAIDLYEGLHDLDRRGTYLQQIVRPDIDGQFLQRVMQPQQEQEDPYAPFYAEEQPEEEQYYEPQAPAFDPRQYAEIIKNDVTQSVMGQLQQMALDQQVKESASSAVQQVGLPPASAPLVEQYVREQQRLQPNRQASDLAAEAARNLYTQFAQWQAAPPAAPAPTGQVPSGPAPDTLQKPRTIEEALEYSKQVLNP